MGEALEREERIGHLDHRGVNRCLALPVVDDDHSSACIERRFGEGIAIELRSAQGEVDRAFRQGAGVCGNTARG